MNPKLLHSQFDRLARNPADTRLLKQLAVEFGSAVIRGRPEWLREYRVAAAAALREIEKSQGDSAVYARGVLCGLLDAAGCAEETLTAEQSRQEVRSVASRPLHRQILRALDGRAQTTKALVEQLGKQKSQVSEALQALEELGLVCAVVRLPQANQKEKPYRLTLTGSLMLDELPLDESPEVAVVPAKAPDQRVEDKPADELTADEWLKFLEPNFDVPGSIEDGACIEFYANTLTALGRKRPSGIRPRVDTVLADVLAALNRKRRSHCMPQLVKLAVASQDASSTVKFNSSWDDPFAYHASNRLAQILVLS